MYIKYTVGIYNGTDDVTAMAVCIKNTVIDQFVAHVSLFIYTHYCMQLDVYLCTYMCIDQLRYVVAFLARWQRFLSFQRFSVGSVILLWRLAQIAIILEKGMLLKMGTISYALKVIFNEVNIK